MAKRLPASVERAVSVACSAAFLCCACLVVAGCGSVDNTSHSLTSSLKVNPPANPRAITIGYVGVGDVLGERSAQMEANTIRGLRKAGYTVRYFKSLSLNPQPQLEAMNRFVNEGVDVLLIDPQFSNSWTDLLVPITSGGVKAVFVDRKPIGIRPSRYSAYVGANTRQLGTKAAQAVVRALKLGEKEDESFEALSAPRTLVVSSFLGSATDRDALSGWNDVASRFFSSVDQAVLGQDPDESQSAFRTSWEKLASQGRLPHVIFATNTVATQRTLAALKSLQVHVVPSVQEAMEKNAQLDSDGVKGWNVALVSLGQKSWLEKQTQAGVLAYGVSLPDDYSPQLTNIIANLVAGNAVAKDTSVAAHEFSSQVFSSQL